MPYNPASRTSKQQPMIAFIVSAYRLPQQLVRLVTRLQGPERHFHVHVDLKARPEVYAEASAALAGYDNVDFLPRHACYWGGFGHVEATLKGLERIVTWTGRACPAPAHVVLLTGQDYPIKSNAEIDRYLAEHAGRSFMHHRPLPVDGLPDGGYARLERRHVVLGGRVRAAPRLSFLPAGWKRRVPYGMAPYFGSGYWCLDRAAVEYIVQFLHTHPAYVRFFRHAGVPDEMFFQTVLANSPLRRTIVRDDLRYIRWPGPAVLTSDDWGELRKAPALFARKFDADVDAAILDRIDRELLRA
jgi:hypothetical protein